MGDFFNDQFYMMTEWKLSHNGEFQRSKQFMFILDTVVHVSC